MMKLLHALLLIGSCHAFSLQMSAGKTTVVAGATGYIGKSVVRESVRQGYKTIALVRDVSKVESDDGKMMYGGYFDGAELVECDVCDPEKLTAVSTIYAKKVSFSPVRPLRTFYLSHINPTQLVLYDS
jgi:FlaA1/EpsC-like NDP-sugar epimerase